jgi:hypothetical protein
VIRCNRFLVLAALTLSAHALSAQATLPPRGQRPVAQPAGQPAAPAAEARSAPAALAAPGYLATRDEALTIGRETTQRVYANQLDALILAADPMDGDLVNLRRNLEVGLPRLSERLGAERRMISERVVRVGGRIEYWRIAEFEKAPAPMLFRVTMGARGKWRGFAAVPQGQAVGGEEVLP